MVGGVPLARIGHMRGRAAVVLFGPPVDITKLSRHGKSIGVVRTLSLARRPRFVGLFFHNAFVCDPWIKGE
jgi:hypothetical protein